MKTEKTEKQLAQEKLARIRVRTRNSIERNLLAQLEANGTNMPTYIDLVQDYLKLWDVKNKLIDDIEENGVKISSFNAKGDVMIKKNESVSELTKYTLQMSKLLVELGLNATNVKVDDDVDL